MLIISANTRKRDATRGRVAACCDRAGGSIRLQSVQLSPTFILNVF